MKKVIALAMLFVLASSTLCFAATGDYCKDEASCRQQQEQQKEQ